MITIESLAPAHFELVAGWLSKPDIARWLTSEWRNRPATATLIAIAVRNRKNRLFLVRYEGQPCGILGLAEIDLTDRTAMLWYAFGEACLSGQGIASEAVKQFMRVSFEQMGLVSVYAWVMEDNIASQRVLQKAGFGAAGRIRCAAVSAGRQVDRIYFDAVADELRVKTPTALKTAIGILPPLRGH